MLLVSYDISNDKLRTQFSRYLSKFGFRLQYSVFQITNSDRVLKNICLDIKNIYEKCFTETDSVIIIKTTESCQKITYGYARHDDDQVLMVF